MRAAVYEVTGSRCFRGHKPGSTFEAALERLAEARAISRGDIRIVKRTTPSLQPGSFTLPSGWLTKQEEVQ